MAVGPFCGKKHLYPVALLFYFLSLFGASTFFLLPFLLDETLLKIIIHWHVDDFD